MSDFFRFLRYPLIFLLFAICMAFHFKAHASIPWPSAEVGYLPVSEGIKLFNEKKSTLFASCSADSRFTHCITHSYKEWYTTGVDGVEKIKIQEQIAGCLPNDSDVRCKRQCDTPKTDDQCNKGKTGWVEGNAAFWASASQGYKGCTFEKEVGEFALGYKFPDGSEEHRVKSTGSTGKSWCETTPSEPPVPESEFPNNPNLTPATDPKECKSGWIKTADGKYYCVASGAEPTPPSKNPDGSINSDKDGNPSPPDANAGKPGDGSGSGGGGDGGGGDGGGGGDCEGEDCEGGGGTKPPARPDDPWSSVLDAADLSKLQADKADVEAELNSFYEQVRNSIRINIGSPSTAPMPSYGFIEQGGQRVELSMSWLDSVDMEGRSAVILLCGLIAASIIFWGRP